MDIPNFFGFAFLGGVLGLLGKWACAERSNDEGGHEEQSSISRTSGVINAVVDGVEYVCAVRLSWKQGARVSDSYVHLFEDNYYNRWVEYAPGSDIITSAKRTKSGRLHWAYNAVIVPWINDAITNEEIREWDDEGDNRDDPEDVFTKEAAPTHRIRRQPSRQNYMGRHPTRRL